MIATDVDEFIGELNAGVFRNKLAMALSEVAAGTVMHGDGPKKGKITIEIVMTKMGDHDQVILSHKLGMSVPTKRGKRTEEDTTDTAMFVGKGGRLTIEVPREDESGQFNLKPV